MVIDTSALVAILSNDRERRAFNEAIEGTESRSLSTASFVETSMVLESRYGADAVRDLDLFLATARIALSEIDAEQAHLAREAFRRYGKGRHHAGLNFGDCFSYALARILDAPLLFKGDEFSRTDVACHPASPRPTR